MPESSTTPEQSGEVPQRETERAAAEQAASVTKPHAERPELSEYAHPEVEVAQEAHIRRYPSTLGGLVYLIVLGATVAGIAVAATGRWRLGVLWVGAAMLCAAAVRLVLPENQAGMLHVRRRLVDVALLVILGGGLLAAAVTIPGPWQVR